MTAGPASAAAQRFYGGRGAAPAGCAVRIATVASMSADRSTRPQQPGRDSAGAAQPAPARPRDLVVKLTAGADAPERCSQGFTVAALAAASGARVSLWLTGESAWFALPGRAEQFELPHAAPLEDLLAAVLAVGSVSLCTQCAARRGIDEKDLRPGVRIAGAQVFVQEVLAPEVQALVY
jgi:predicted peroxiredoxin